MLEKIKIFDLKISYLVGSLYLTSISTIAILGLGSILIIIE